MDYTAKIAKAEAKIARYGCEITYIRKNAAYEPVEGNVWQEDTEQAIRGLLTSPKEQALASGTIQIGDMWLLIAGNALPDMPATGDMVRIGGNLWRVEEFTTVMPDATPLLYKLQIRRS